jgi:hypothetical protein
MPYKPDKQRAYLHIHHPELAERWDAKYGGKISSKKQTPRSKKSRKRANRRQRNGGK